MTQYHEPPQELSAQDRDIVRAWISLKEEVEAVYWYHQRAATCTDPELKKILEHNRDEEIEHATMSLEWLRRLLPVVDKTLREYLFTTGSIVDIEQGGSDASTPGEEEPGAGKTVPAGTGLGIGRPE